MKSKMPSSYYLLKRKKKISKKNKNESPYELVTLKPSMASSIKSVKKETLKRYERMLLNKVMV